MDDQLFVLVTFLQFISLIYFLWAWKEKLPFSKLNKKNFVLFIGFIVVFAFMSGYYFFTSYQQVFLALTGGMLGIGLMNLQVKLSPKWIKRIVCFVFIAIVFFSWQFDCDGSILILGIIIGAALYGGTIIMLDIVEAI
ncbi:MAG: hypothetical protein WC842_04270 [Candidatus Paceibacterota bacterium]|jgi:hypothetical protein